jgi:hypothetical protein
LGVVAWSAVAVLALLLTSLALLTRESGPSSQNLSFVDARGVRVSLTVTPAALRFGEVSVGSTSPAEPVTVLNDGEGELRLEQMAVTGVHAPEFAAPTESCQSGPLTPGARCAVAVAFAPAAAGTRRAALELQAGAVASWYR